MHTHTHTHTHTHLYIHTPVPYIHIHTHRGQSQIQDRASQRIWGRDTIFNVSHQQPTLHAGNIWKRVLVHQLYWRLRWANTLSIVCNLAPTSTHTYPKVKNQSHSSHTKLLLIFVVVVVVVVVFPTLHSLIGCLSMLIWTHLLFWVSYIKGFRPKWCISIIYTIRNKLRTNFEKALTF